jgi:hypothetical protein
MLKVRYTLLLVIMVIASMFTVYAMLIRPWHMRWGATVEEVSLALPGDTYIPERTIVSTRAITIRAPREAIWPWIVQLGQGRGGFYSYEWLENLFAADMHNADEIIPEYQHLEVGDHISFQRNGPFAVVAYIEEGQTLVGEGGWAWYLQAVDNDTTRLVVRYASFKVDSFLSRLFYYSIFEPAHFVMEQGMMLGIKSRAENMPQTDLAEMAR